MSQDLINLSVTGAGVVAFWFLKMLWESNTRLERELHQDYVRRNDFRADMDEIKDILKQIFDKLDKKADK
jgi:hypothetical protein